MLKTFPSAYPILFLFAIYSGSVLSRAEFTQGYEAAQSGDYKRAIQIWKPLAEESNVAAQYTLGWLYESGQGVKQNNQQAAYWYTKAAKQGDVAAQYVLATMYNKGKGLPVDHSQAVYWFTKAANQGDAIAQFKLGVHFQKGLDVKASPQQSLIWFTKAARQGHLNAQINLGKIYQSGKGIKQDYKQAIFWYEKAATQGNALAQFHLGFIHEHGHGVIQNHQKAKEFYLQSAHNHYAPGAYKVAEYYELGKGIEVNFKQAFFWYQQAANKGNSAAQFKLGSMYQNGTGTAQNIHSAIEWYSRAILQNHVQAFYQLGLIFDEGVINDNGEWIIKEDKRKAAIYYQKASQLDYNLAFSRLAFLYENGLGVEVNNKRALSLYQKSTEDWAKIGFKRIHKQNECLQNATTKLFSVAIKCTNRDIFSQQIKSQKITAISENLNNWSDIYFTGAIIRGTSQLEVFYTQEELFASATYTFIGRNKLKLIWQVKKKLVQKYGSPSSSKGDVTQGEASFQWLLADGIILTVNRGWPDTTTFVTYLFPENQALLEKQQYLSKNKIDSENQINDEIQSDLF